MARSLEELDQAFKLRKELAANKQSEIDTPPEGEGKDALHEDARPRSSAVRSKSLEELDQSFQTRLKSQPGRTAAKPGQKSPNWKEKGYFKSEQWHQWRVFLIQTGCTMLAVYLLMTLVIGITVIHGDSMQPTLYDSDIALVWRLSGKYEAGDIILFSSEAFPDALVKRVVAGPGDILEIDNETGKVIVNNVILDEPYIYSGTYTRNGNNDPIILGENEYFVLGDNRMVALDSRDERVGTIMKGEIMGKIVFLVRVGGVLKS